MTTTEAPPTTDPSGVASADAGGPEPDLRPHRRLEVLGAAIVVVVPILVALAHAARQPWVPTADNALIELRSWDIPGHIPLVGVYSRFGFHHPGPILFFVNSLPVHLLGPKGVLLATGATNALALVGSVVLLDRRGGRPLLLGGTVVLLLLERAVAAQLLDPWNPWVTTMPFALLLLAVWSVWCRDWMALPVAALAATYVVQAHLGFGPLVAVLGALAVGVTVGAVWRERRRGAGASPRATDRTSPEPSGVAGSRRAGRGPAAALGVTVLLLAVLWALPLVDLATQHPTNVGLIRQSLQNPEQPPAGPGQATDVAVHAIGASVPWITGQEEVEPFSNRVLGTDWWTMLPVIAAVGAGAVLAARARVRPAARDALRFQAVVGLAAVVGWVSVVRITGNAYPYLVRWMWVIGAFAWLSAAWSAFAGWPRPLRRVTPPLPVAAAAVLVVGLVAGVAAYQAPLPATADAVATLAVVNPAMGELQAAGTIVVRHEGTDLAEIPQGVYAELVRRGLPAYVTTADSFVTGEHHFLGDRRADATLVVATADAVDVHQWTGEKPIASYDRLTPEERTEYFRLAARAAAGYGQATRNEPITDPLNPTDAARVRDLAERSTRVALFLTRNP